MQHFTKEKIGRAAKGKPANVHQPEAAIYDEIGDKNFRPRENYEELNMRTLKPQNEYTLGVTIQPSAKDIVTEAPIKTAKKRKCPIAVICITIAIIVCFAVGVAGVILAVLPRLDNQEMAGEDAVTGSEDVDLASLRGQLQVAIERITQLENELNATKNEVTTAQSGLNTFRSTFTGQLSNLTTSTQSQLGSLTTTVNNLNSQQTSTQNQLGGLTTSFNDLNSAVHSPVQLYQNCYTLTAETRMEPSSNIYYRRRIYTPYRVINATDYYTLDIRCHYESSYAYTVVTQLRRLGISMRCYCVVSRPHTTFDSLYTLPTSSIYYLDCILSITRCPLSQTIV